MIRDFININSVDYIAIGLDVHIKKIDAQMTFLESFLVVNHCVLLIKSGSFKIRIKEFIQELNCNDLFVLPMDTYCTFSDIEGGLELFTISFTPDFAFENCLNKEMVESFTLLLLDHSKKLKLSDNDYAVLSLIYKVLFLFIRKGEVNDQTQKLQRISFNLFLNKLMFICKGHLSAVQNHTSRQETLTIQFLEVLAIHCRKQHSVAFYAGALFVTPDYLNKVIKQVTGKTAKSLVSQAIVNEIKNMLENSQLSISSISQEFEFTSLSKFSEFFKRYTSVSPSQYRSSAADRFNGY